MRRLVDHRLMDVIDAALREDVGLGDITTACTVPTDLPGRGTFIARQSGVLSGLEIARMVLERIDASLHFAPHTKDGSRVLRGMELATVTGHVASMLTAERVALNFMQRMSGIATRTAGFVERVKDLPVHILDTRKTAPGLRAFDRIAVRDGGGRNHRFGLDDMALIKDNHVAACGGVKEAVELTVARLSGNERMKIEVEVDSLSQLSQILSCDGVDVILLDNFSTEDLSVAVRLIRTRKPNVLIEASGNIREETVRDVAETGVDRISIGALTHSVHALDISFDIVSEYQP